MRGSTSQGNQRTMAMFCICGDSPVKILLCTCWTVTIGSSSLVAGFHSTGKVGCALCCFLAISKMGWVIDRIAAASKLEPNLQWRAIQICESLNCKVIVVIYRWFPFLHLRSYKIDLISLLELRSTGINFLPIIFASDWFQTSRSLSDWRIFRRFDGDTRTAGRSLLFEDRVFFEGESGDEFDECVWDVLGVVGRESEI